MQEFDRELEYKIIGLDTKFRSKKIKIVPKETTELENFITDLQRELLYEVFNQRKYKAETKMDNFMKKLLIDLNSDENLIVPMDKTNRYISLKV